MMNMITDSKKHQEEERSFPIPGAILWTLAVLIGAAAAFYGIRYWLPAMAGSLSGQEPQGYWFLSRSTAIVAYLLFWLNTIMGMGISSKLTKYFPGGMLLDIHQYLSILGWGFALVHALLLLGDVYLNYSLTQILIPFGSSQYRPLWVALGQIGLYIWLFIYISFYIRKLIGKRTWRILHYFGFIAFLGILIHGIMAGSDTGSPIVTGMYWSTGSVFLVTFIYRIAAKKIQNVSKEKMNPV